MALSVKVGTFNCAAGTGNQSITGLGFLPKAIIFFSSEQNSDDAKAANLFLSIGCATSSTARWAQTGITEHNQATADSFSRRSNTRCLALTNVAGTVIQEADFVSMDADGFTINMTVASGTAYRVGYIALGGTDITDAKAGESTITSGTGTIATTGVGFLPTLLFLSKNINGTGTSVSDALMSLGVANATQQAAFGTWSQRNAAAGNSVSVLRSDRCLASLIPGLSSSSLSSLDADGFTINRIESAGTSWVLGYLALAGTFSSSIGVETQKTTTGTRATTGLGIQPGIVLFGSAGKTVSATSTVHAVLSFGAGDGTNEACVSGDDQDAADPTQAGGSYSNAKVMRFTTTGAGGSPTITTNAEADVTSLDADGFTLDWTTADGTAREFWYLALGSAVIPDPDYHYRLAWKATKNAATAEFTLPRHNPDAAGAPTATDDADALYSPGSRVLYDGIEYLCTDATPGAAVWVAQVPTGTNLLANGSFRVAQRGTGPFTSATTPANNDYAVLVDTWRLISDGNDVVDVSRTIDAANLCELALDVETANKKFGVLSWVEAKNVQEAKTYSLQVRVRATGGGSGFGTVKAAIICYNGTADVLGDPISAWGADGVSPTLNAAYSYLGSAVASTALAPGASATLTLEGIVDATGAHNVGVMVWNDDTTTTAGDFIYIANAKLEVGSACSTFEPGPYSDELAHCQRYFFALGGSTNRLPATGRADGTSTGFWTFPLGHEMRAAPTIAIVGTGAFRLNDGSVQLDVTAIATNFSSTQCIAGNFTTSASTMTVGRTLFAVFSDATTFLQATAEL